MNPTSQKYFDILAKYWNLSEGNKVVLIHKNGIFAKDKKDLIKIFANSEGIDVIVNKLFFDRKILIIRRSGTNWGITCVKMPTLEMADELRIEANKLKYKSEKSIASAKKSQKALF